MAKTTKAAAKEENMQADGGVSDAAPNETKQPAKPAKAAKRTSAAKSRKTAAKKSRGSAKKTAAAKKSAPQPSAAIEPSDDEIRIRAYFIAEWRQRESVPGDAARDWIEARRQLLEELGG